MRNLTRITFDPNVMGGKLCIRGLRGRFKNMILTFCSEPKKPDSSVNTFLWYRGFTPAPYSCKE